MPCNPLFYSFLVLLPGESVLFIEESRLNWPVSSSQEVIYSRSLHIWLDMHQFDVGFRIHPFIIFLPQTLQRLNVGGSILEVQFQ
jgi:hypothetical protein